MTTGGILGKGLQLHFGLQQSDLILFTATIRSREFRRHHLYQHYKECDIGSFIIYCVRCVIITWISIIPSIWSSIICTSIINNQILLRVSIASTSMRLSGHLSHFDLWHVERALCCGAMWGGRTLKSCLLIPQQGSPGGVVVHCCPSLCWNDAETEMINTKSQWEIQRSSWWAINSFKIHISSRRH